VTTVTQHTPTPASPDRTISIECVGDIPELSTLPELRLSWERVIVERHDGRYVRHHGLEFANDVCQSGGVEATARAVITTLNNAAATAGYRLVEAPPMLTPSARTIGVELIGPEVLNLDPRYAHTSTRVIVERVGGEFLRVLGDDSQGRIRRHGIECTARDYSFVRGATFAPSPPEVPYADRVMGALAAARVEGLSLDAAILAALLAGRFYLPAAHAVDLAAHDAFDERVRVVSTRRDELIDAANRAWLAAEYGETPAATSGAGA
jgi:hypothetical protein